MSRAAPAAVACVYVPALTLQIALRQQTLTRDAPGVVCAGTFVVWPNRAAKRAGIKSGMRVAQARALAPMLQTASVSPHEQQQATQELWQHLLQFSPAIEPDAQQPGLLWLDPNGLRHLFGTHAQWCAAVQEHLRERQYHTVVGVGFNRYLTFSMASRSRACFVCESPAHEVKMAHALPLAEAPLPADVREALLLLGATTLGDFLSMPVSEVRQCLGAAAEHLHRLAHDQIWAPLTPQAWVAPNETEQTLDSPDADAHRLLFVIKSMLLPMLEKLPRSCQACVGVHVQLHIDKKQSLYEHIQPAAPTLDARRLVDLIRLRLTAITLSQPVTCITVRIQSCVVRPEQLSMLQQKPKRDVRAATWALAKVRALMGEHAVTRASLCDSHLPELSFCWEPLTQVVLPQVASAPQTPWRLIRAVRRTRMPLPSPPKRDIRQWLRHEGGIESMHGPYRLHAAWWRKATERDYYYIQTDAQHMLWVYYNRLENRWFRQGHIA